MVEEASVRRESKSVARALRLNFRWSPQQQTGGSWDGDCDRLQQRCWLMVYKNVRTMLVANSIKLSPNRKASRRRSRQSKHIDGISLSDRLVEGKLKLLQVTSEFRDKLLIHKYDKVPRKSSRTKVEKQNIKNWKLYKNKMSGNVVRVNQVAVAVILLSMFLSCCDGAQFYTLPKIHPGSYHSSSSRLFQFVICLLSHLVCQLLRASSMMVISSVYCGPKKTREYFIVFGATTTNTGRASNRVSSSSSLVDLSWPVNARGMIMKCTVSSYLHEWRQQRPFAKMSKTCGD